MPEVLDTPALDATVETPVDSAVDTDASVDTATDTDTSTSDTDTSTESSTGSLWDKSKGYIKELQSRDPKLAKELKAAINSFQRQQKDFPDGLGAVAQLRDAIQQFSDDPGKSTEQVIQETLSERDYYRELDQAFTNGSPEFVDKMIDASPEAFQKIAPSVFAKFAETNPDGYSAYVSQVILNDMGANDVPLMFKQLAYLVPRMPDSPEKAEVVDLVNKFHAWTERFREFAKKPVTQVAEKKVDFTQKEQELAQRESEAMITMWNASTTNYGRDLIASEIQRIAGKNQVSEDVKQKIGARVVEELEARLAVDKTFRQSRDSFIANKNQESYKRLMHSKYKGMIPAAVQRAYGDVVKTTATPKPAATPAKGANGRFESSKPASDGFRRVDGYPGNDRVDLRAMRSFGVKIADRKAILKDGTKVTW